MTATWRIELNAECPHCGDYFDFFSSDYYEQLPGIAECGYDLDLHVNCPTCKKELIIDNVEY